MLSIDAIVMLYHCAKVSAGNVLEVGSYVGGATIAMAMGVRDSGEEKRIISIERGCRVEHPRIGTKDSFKDLRKNLRRFGFLDRVTLINGRSFDPSTITVVRQVFGPRQIGLFVFDADANVRRDINCYCDQFADHCWMVIDDYLGGRKQERTPANTSGRVGQRWAIGAAGLLRFRNVDWPLANPDGDFFKCGAANIRRGFKFRVLGFKFERASFPLLNS